MWLCSVFNSSSSSSRRISRNVKSLPALRRSSSRLCLATSSFCRKCGGELLIRYRVGGGEYLFRPPRNSNPPIRSVGSGEYIFRPIPPGISILPSAQYHTSPKYPRTHPSLPHSIPYIPFPDQVGRSAKTTRPLPPNWPTPLPTQGSTPHPIGPFAQLDRSQAISV